MRDTLAPDANIRHRPLLLNELKKYVTTYTGLRGIEVKKDGILCSNSLGKNIFISGSTVICALGQRTNHTAVHSLLNCAPFVRIIGDANRVSTITNAVYQGYHAALDI